MADVFISYARQDREAADLLRITLEKLGLTTFMDIEGGISAGDSFPQRITEAVAASKVVLACWTPFALSRDWVRRECLLARHYEKLVPIALQPLEPTDLREFIDVSYEDLTDFTPVTLQHFGWSQTLQALARRIEQWGGKSSDPDARSDVSRLGPMLRQTAASTRPPGEPPTKHAFSSASALWEQLGESEDIDALTNFADSFPGRPEAFEARNRITRLRRGISALENALSSGDRGVVEQFLSEWPSHPRKQEALAHRDRLLNAERESEARRMEVERKTALEAEAHRRRAEDDAREVKRRQKEAATHARAVAEERVEIADREAETRRNRRRVGQLLMALVGGGVLVFFLFRFGLRSDEDRFENVVAAIAFVDPLHQEHYVTGDAPMSLSDGFAEIEVSYYVARLRATDNISVVVTDTAGATIYECPTGGVVMGVYNCELHHLQNGTYLAKVIVSRHTVRTFSFAVANAIP